MRLPGPSMPSQRQSQTAAGIALIVLAFFTAFAMTQAVLPIQDKPTLVKRDTNVEARQFLPWIFGGGQSTTAVNPAQPVITTALPAAAPVTPNNQQQQGPLGGVIPQVGHVIPSLLASLTLALAAVVTPVPSILNPGNVVPVLTNFEPAVVESILQNGGGPVIPTAIPSVEGSNGGLLDPVQSVINSIAGVSGSVLPLPAGSVLSVPLPTQVVGGIPVSEVTAAIGNGASIITNIPEVLVSVVSSIVGHVPSAIGVSDIAGATAAIPSLSSLIAAIPTGIGNPVIISSIESVLQSLQSASAVLPLPTTGPQLPGDLPTDGGLCSVIKIESGIPTFLATPCPESVPPPFTQAASSSGVPVSNSGAGPASPPVSSQTGPSTPLATPTAEPPQSPSAASPPAGGANATLPANNPSMQAGAGSPGNNDQPQNTAPAGQAQPPMQSSSPTNPVPANPPPAATQDPNQASSGAGSPPPASAPAASPLTTLIIAAGTPASNPTGVPANGGNGQRPSPNSQPGGSIFGVDDGQDPFSGNNIPPGTPVIPISDCPAVVQCPACPASPAKPPAGSCPCPGRGYSCSECLNGWFCPPEETPMLPAPCGMGWPCYHCKGGWYCAPDSKKIAPAAANDPIIVVIKTMTAFVAPQPTGAGNGGTGDGSNNDGFGDGGNGNGGNGNGTPDNGTPVNGDSGNGGSPAVSTPCTTTDNGQYTDPPGNGAGSAPNPNPDNSGNGKGNNDPDNGNTGNGAAPGAGDPGNAASTPCTTTSGQPTNPSRPNGSSGNGSGSGGPANVPEPPIVSPAPPPSNPNPTVSPEHPPSPVSPAPNGIPDTGFGNGQGNPGAGNPPAGYGNSPTGPANGNPNNGPGPNNSSGNGSDNGSGSGAPSGNGTPGNTGPSSPAPGSNAGAGSGNGSPSNNGPKAAAEVTGWEYLGCFKDSAVRTLDGDPSIYFTGGMSNEKCVAHCGSMGFQLAGTEYGKECWCGTAFQLAVRIPEEQCNEVCDGKSTDICGGDWAVTVYSKTGQTLSLPSDDDVANGPGAGNGNGNSNGNGNGNGGSGTGNNGGTGNPQSTPQSTAPAPPAAPPASPPQTPGQGQSPPLPAGNPQDSKTPPASPNPAPQPQIDIASLIQSIINALPKSSPDGAYGSGLGARDSGASGNNGPVTQVNPGVPDDVAGGSPMMGPGPCNPPEGLDRYGAEKREVASRNMKRSSIIGRRAVAKFDGVICDGENEYEGDYLAKAQV